MPFVWRYVQHKWDKSGLGAGICPIFFVAIYQVGTHFRIEYIQFA